jgi:hypothetical protein
MEKAFSIKLSGELLEIFEELRGEKTPREMVENLIRYYPAELIEYAAGRDTDDLLEQMIKTYEEWKGIRWVPDTVTHSKDSVRKYLGLDPLSTKGQVFDLSSLSTRKIYKASDNML